MASIYQGTAFIKGLRLGGSNDNDGGKPPKLYRGADQLWPKAVPYVEPTYDVIITTTEEFLPLPNALDTRIMYPNPEDPNGNWLTAEFNEEYFTDTSAFHYGRLFLDRTDITASDPNFYGRPIVVAPVQDFVVEDGQIKYNFVNSGDATINTNAFTFPQISDAPSFGRYLTAVDITAAMGIAEVQPNPSLSEAPLFGFSAFEYTTMTSIKVKGITHMSHTMFGNINGATSVSQTDDTAGIYLPDLTDMSYAARAFAGSSTLTSISLPNVTRIGDRRLFHGCSNVTAIDLSGLDPAQHVDGNGATRLAWNAEVWGDPSTYDDPGVQSLFSSTDSFLVFRDVASTCRLTIPVAFQTNGPGDGPDPEIVAFLAQGESREVIYV